MIWPAPASCSHARSADRESARDEAVTLIRRDRLGARVSLCTILWYKCPIEAYISGSAPGSRSALFGAPTRQRVLLLLALVESVHLREAARGLGASVNAVQKAVVTLEAAGVVGSRIAGRARIVTLNRRWIAAAELRTLLERMAEADPIVTRAADQLRADRGASESRFESYG